MSFQYLSLVESVARETVAQGNPHIIITDYATDGEFTWDLYDEKTRWSDHKLIIPTLFCFYHAIELLLKGFLLLQDGAKAEHKLEQQRIEFAQIFSEEAVISEFLTKYIDVKQLPPLLASFMKKNNVTINNFYEALRYPTDRHFQRTKEYLDLKYRGEDGLRFFKELIGDIRSLRVAAVRLGRSFEPTAEAN